jgi:hypothetical protein
MNLAHNSFRFTHSKIERIEHAERKNSFLDSSPTKLHTGKTKEQLMDLRPRIKDKEIAHATFRHSATTRFEQVYDSLSKRTSSVIAPRDILDPTDIYRNRGKSVL